jgi:hypothetical protein
MSGPGDDVLSTDAPWAVAAAGVAEIFDAGFANVRDDVAGADETPGIIGAVPFVAAAAAFTFA